MAQLDTNSYCNLGDTYTSTRIHIYGQCHIHVITRTCTVTILHIRTENYVTFWTYESGRLFCQKMNWQTPDRVVIVEKSIDVYCIQFWDFYDFMKYGSMVIFYVTVNCTLQKLLESYTSFWFNWSRFDQVFLYLTYAHKFLYFIITKSKSKERMML